MIRKPELPAIVTGLTLSSGGATVARASTPSVVPALGPGTGAGAATVAEYPMGLPYRDPTTGHWLRPGDRTLP